MGTMLAAVLHNINDLRLERVAIPQAEKPGQVVVRIHSCGVCATDWKAVTGRRRNVAFPFIAGHEPSGVVAEVGPGVSHFAPGPPRWQYLFGGERCLDPFPERDRTCPGGDVRPLFWRRPFFF